MAPDSPPPLCLQVTSSEELRRNIYGLTDAWRDGLRAGQRTDRAGGGPERRLDRQARPAHGGAAEPEPVQPGSGHVWLLPSPEA